MTEEKTIEIRKQYARYCWKHMNIFQKMKWRFTYKLWEEDWVKSVEIQELKKQLEQSKEIIRN